MKKSLSIKKEKLREFGLVFGFGLPIILGFLVPLLNGHDKNIWSLFLGFPFIFLGVFSPKILEKPYYLWMKIGFLLGWINSRIILGFIFIVVLQPIALIMKMLKYDPLRKKISKEKISYREIISKDKIDLTKIF
ncbi:MAG: SxtJ family membrane protein [Prochlorococcus marinus CUG1437]|nr:SxtJ family membrane protein [Prochlorococcus marinus CUG1437]